jgi:hypothetical protein
MSTARTTLTQRADNITKQLAALQNETTAMSAKVATVASKVEEMSTYFTVARVLTSGGSAVVVITAILGGIWGWVSLQSRVAALEALAQTQAENVKQMRQTLDDLLITQNKLAELLDKRNPRQIVGALVVRGWLLEATSEKITVKDDEGTIHKFSIGKHTTIDLHGKSAKVHDLIAFQGGAEVDVLVSNGGATHIDVIPEKKVVPKGHKDGGKILRFETGPGGKKVGPK